jgi:hypothetical protein
VPSHEPSRDDNPDTEEELRARLIASKAALAQIDELAGEEGTRDDTAQREALIEMRRDGKISNEVTNKIRRELDLEESRLEI